MTNESPDLQDLLKRIRAGDEDAARELLENFEAHVRRVVRSRLPAIMRSKFDSMDFVQSVWGEFFPKLTRGDIDFDSPNKLARFLALVAQSKVTNEYRRRFSKRFNLQKEVAMDTALFYVPGKEGDPTPSQNLAASEQLEAIMARRPESHRKVVELRSQGFTFVEIAKTLRIDERTARRILHGIEQELGLKNAGERN